MSDHKQRRKDRIDKVFPCNESSIIRDLIEKIIIEDIISDGEIIDFSKYKQDKDIAWARVVSIYLTQWS